MPAGLYTGQDAEDVAAYVAAVAGSIPMDEARARELLARERERIERSLADLDRRRRRGALADVDQHPADAGSELFETEREAGLATQLREELAAVERAEQRVPEGKFGLSVESGDPIPDERSSACPGPSAPSRSRPATTGTDGHVLSASDAAHVLRFQSFLLDDAARLDTWHAAILATVRPGDVVLDLGAGMGILSLFACQAGAARVYAVESEPSVELARLVAADNGLEERIICLGERSQDVELPERADVLLTDTTETFGLNGQLLSAVIDARERLLKPEARLLPGEIELRVAPVEAPGPTATSSTSGRATSEGSISGRSGPSPPTTSSRSPSTRRPCWPSRRRSAHSTSAPCSSPRSPAAPA